MDPLATFEQLALTYETTILPRIRKTELDSRGLGPQYPYSRYSVLGMFLAIASSYFRAFHEIAGRAAPNNDASQVAGTPVRMRRYLLLVILGAYLDEDLDVDEKRKCLEWTLSLYDAVLSKHEEYDEPLDEQYAVGPDFCGRSPFLQAYIMLDSLSILLREYCDVLWLGEHPISFEVRGPRKAGAFYTLERIFTQVDPLGTRIRLVECYSFRPRGVRIDDFGGSITRKPPRSQRSGVAVYIDGRPVAPDHVGEIIPQLIARASTALDDTVRQQPENETALVESAARAYCYELARLASLVGKDIGFIDTVSRAARKTSEVVSEYCRDGPSVLPSRYADECSKALSFVRGVLGSELPVASCQRRAKRDTMREDYEEAFRVVGTPDDCVPSSIGAKARNLQLLHSLGYNTPPTVVIPASVVENMIGRDSRTVGMGDYMGKQSRFHALVVSSVNELAKLCKTSKPMPVIVRSSGPLEDTARRTRAGMYQSFSNLSNEMEVVTAVAKCATQKLGRTHTGGVNTTVVIQPYESFMLGGVTMSVDPVTGGQDTLLCEASKEGPTGVTSGARVDWRVAVRRDNLTLSDVDESCGSPLGDGLQGIVVKTAEAALELEAVFGEPVDIEWGALDFRTIVYLQVRAVIHKNARRVLRHGEPPAGWIEVLRGIPASPGVSKGRAVFPGEPLSKATGNTVLVRGVLEPESMGLLFQADALVCESGGVNSHASINCREMGVPCVVGAARATSLIPRDSTIIVSGTDGRVYMKASESQCK